MNVVDRGILTGMALGDGYLSVRQRLKDGKYPYWKSELVVVHSAAQADYCAHKASLVRRIFGGECRVHDTAATVKGKTYGQVRFTKSNPYFKTLHSVMYPEGRKTYTRRVLDLLTPHGIALWYMDDGSCHVNLNDRTGVVSSTNTSIATMCSSEEAQVICDYFAAKHEIEFKIRTRKASPEDRQCFVVANTANGQKFARLVQPYIIPSMLYKLAHVANLNTHECRAPVMTCVNCGAPTFKANRLKGMCTTCYTRQYTQNRRRYSPSLRETEPQEAQDKEPAR